MKKLVVCGVLLGAFVGSAMAVKPSAACAAKRTDIEARLADATAHGQKREVTGLQRALRANQANCSDFSLAQERANDIRQARKKVAERERNLAAARRKGDVEKIALREEKLDEARRELAHAEKPIHP